MSPSPDWYLSQAALLTARADECRRVAIELEDSPLPTLLAFADDDTWQCPAAADFREFIVISQGRILDAIADLESNAYGLANEADNMARAAAHEAERRRSDAEALARAADQARPRVG